MVEGCAALVGLGVPVWRVGVDEDVVGDGAVVGEGEVYVEADEAATEAGSLLVRLDRRRFTTTEAATPEACPPTTAEACAEADEAATRRRRRRLQSRVLCLRHICKRLCLAPHQCLPHEDQVLVIIAGMDAKARFRERQGHRSASAEEFPNLLGVRKKLPNLRRNLRRDLPPWYCMLSSSSAFTLARREPRSQFLNFALRMR